MNQLSKKSKKNKYQQTKGGKINQRKKDLNSIKEFAKKNPLAAKTDLLRYLEENPNDMYGYFFYGSLEEQLGNFESARRIFTKVVISESKNRYSAMVRIGEVLRKQGNVQLAKSWYRRAITESPNEEVYATHMLARLECLGKNYEEAIRILKLLKTQNECTKLELIRALSLAGKIKEASDILKEVTPETQEDKNLVSLEKGKIAKRHNDIAGAKFHFNNVISSELKNEIYAKTLHELVQIQYNENDFLSAKENCEEMITMGYDFDKTAQLLLGQCQQKLGLYDKAIESFHQATTSKEYETRVAGYRFLGTLQFLKGDFVAATEFLERSNEGDLKPAYDTLIKLTALYFKQERYQEMEQCIAILKKYYAEVTSSSGISTAETILAKTTGRKVQSRGSYSTYGEKQIIQYIPQEAIKHIRVRHANDCTKSSNFSNKVNIEELFEEIKLQMVPENKVNENLMDTYEIDYKDAGYDQNNNLVHRIKVIALPGTLNILTMYPSDLSSSPRQEDIRKQIESQKEIRKVHSRIERFNQRYARN